VKRGGGGGQVDKGKTEKLGSRPAKPDEGMAFFVDSREGGARDEGGKKKDLGNRRGRKTGGEKSAGGWGITVREGGTATKNQKDHGKMGEIN